MADIIIARLKPVVDAIDRLTAAVAESNRLESLRLQSIDGLTTHIVQATKQDLADTQIVYNDQEWMEVVGRLADAKGRELTDEELEMAHKAWSEIEKEEAEA